MVKVRGRALCALPGLAAGLLVFIALGNGVVYAQGSTASITGTVNDATGAVVQGAVITARHLDTGLARTVEADSNGSFSIPSLPVGAYEITAEKMGFRPDARRGGEFAGAQEARLKLTLGVGTVGRPAAETHRAPLMKPPAS